MKKKDNHKIVLLRITTISHSLDLLLKGQLKYVDKHGFEVHMACTEDDRTTVIAERENAQFHSLTLSRSLSPIADLLSLFNAIRLISRIRPAIVHTHSPKAGIVGILAAWICRVPVRIHTIAGLPLTETDGLKRKLLIAVERLTYRLATKVWPNSIEQMKFIFEEGIYKNQEKFEVLGKGGSNGIDLSYFTINNQIQEQALQFRRDNSIQNSDIVLSFVGRLAYYKGVNELVEAFCSLQEKYTHLKLLLIGPFEDINPLEPEILNQIRTNKDIFAVGHQSDIRSFLAASDIFVFPSYREGFPQSLMQACAMGLPVITTDINGCNEIITNNERGILIPVKDIDAIIKGIEKYLGDCTFRLLMAKSGQDFIRKYFDQEAFWNIIIAHYNSELAKSSR